MTTHNLVPGWAYSKSRTLLIPLAAILATWLTGLASVLIWGPLSSTGVRTPYSDLIFWAFPVSSLIWVVTNRLAGEKIAFGLSFGISLAALVVWLVGGHTAYLGDIIHAPSSILDIIAWTGALLLVTTLIILLVSWRYLPSLAILLLVAIWPVYRILEALFLGDFAYSRIGFLATTLFTTLSTATIWSVIIESILLVIWEFNRPDNQEPREGVNE